MMPEAEYLRKLLEQTREEVASIPNQFAAFKRKADRKIDDLCEQAGILNDVEAVRDSIEAAKRQFQTQADNLQGRILVLQNVYDKYHVAPIPEGVTHMYGIELESLAPMSRLKLMKGQSDPSWRDMVVTLGGDPDRPDWDGTDPEPSVPDEPPSLPEPHGYLPPDPNNDFEATAGVFDEMFQHEDK